MNLEQELKDQAKEAEEYQNFIHDKLIALATAILGFTVVMIGEGKLKGLNLCLLKISWVLFGTYLAIAIGYMWSSLRWKVLTKTRGSLIKLDLAQLEQQPETQDTKEKCVVLSFLSLKEFFNKAYRKRKSADPYYEKFKEFYQKHKDALETTRYLKDQGLNHYDFKDRAMEFFIYHGEWAYLAFGLGLVFLLVSAL
jgi:hypothetical protein